MCSMSLAVAGIRNVTFTVSEGRMNTVCQSPAPPPAKKRRFHWEKLLASKFLLVSIAVHRDRRRRERRVYVVQRYQGTGS